MIYRVHFDQNIDIFDIRLGRSAFQEKHHKFYVKYPILMVSVDILQEEDQISGLLPGNITTLAGPGLKTAELSHSHQVIIVSNLTDFVFYYKT